ncbi:MAG: YihY/virulence factor BrkB family protein [Gordonia sp. (in: high G+C Gram-positive bacteria)]
MPIASRVDAFHRRYPKTGYPLAVLYKYFDDQGGYLAALIAYYGLVSLFPLLLAFTTILGVVLEHHEHLREEILSSTLQQIPVVGDQIADPSSLSGGAVAVVIGMTGALYGGLGVAVASQNAMNVVWNVPRNSRPNPIMVRVRGLLLLATVGLAMVGLVALNITAAAVDLGSLGNVLLMIGTALIALAVFAFAFRFGTARAVSLLDVLPGAVIAAIGWQALQHFGSVYVRHVIARVSSVNSVFATVLGLIAFLYLAAVMVVFCLEINSVRVDKLYPRSLLTEFTDDVVLTDGDEKAYRQMAQAQRNKGFERIEVTFDNPLTRDDETTAPAPTPAADDD